MAPAAITIEWMAMTLVTNPTTTATATRILTNPRLHPPPPPCIGCGGGGGSSNNHDPSDPNDLIGPGGYGSVGFITPGAALPYTIEFSNEKTAKVPADNVIVTEQLSPNLNWSTFQLGTIGFGSYVVNVPPGLTSYSTRVDAVATLGVYVDIDASLNLSTGLLTVTFTSLDPDDARHAVEPARRLPAARHRSAQRRGLH